MAAEMQTLEEPWMAETVSPNAKYVMIVRRGDPELYLALKERLDNAGAVQVILDRRGSERRLRERRTQARGQSDDRRQTDRRRDGFPPGIAGLLLARAGAKPGSES